MLFAHRVRWRSSHSHAVGRAAAVFCLALVAMVLLAGPGLRASSRNNHFVALADGWLHGRLAHDGRPPGYCDARSRARKLCRTHTFDDWAVVWSLTLRDGSTVRGYPCRTDACATLKTRERLETWWVLGKGWQRFPTGSIIQRVDTWYVTFPPGPALLMLPFVALFGLRTNDVWITCVLAACIPATLVVLLDRLRGSVGPLGRQHLGLACAWCLGSPACGLGAQGQVWFTAQIAAAMCLFLFLSTAWDARRPFAAGCWLGAAMSCRPTLAAAAVLAVAELLRTRSSPKAWAHFLSPLVVIGGALMLHNWVRFADPIEFGHRFLEIRWQPRIQEQGLFGTAYLWRNLQCLLTLMPWVDDQPPHLKISIHGIALWLSTPWLLYAGWGRDRFPQARGLWLAIVCVALPSLFYQNSGQTQFSYRFAVDWLPMFVVGLAWSGGASRRGFLPLVLAACLMHVWGTYAWIRMPERLFVTQPIGWPFEAEFVERSFHTSSPSETSKL